jgi:hypothetical protein
MPRKKNKQTINESSSSGRFPGAESVVALEGLVDMREN